MVPLSQQTLTGNVSLGLLSPPHPSSDDDLQCNVGSFFFIIITVLKLSILTFILQSIAVTVFKMLLHLEQVELQIPVIFDMWLKYLCFKMNQPCFPKVLVPKM